MKTLTITLLMMSIILTSEASAKTHPDKTNDSNADKVPTKLAGKWLNGTFAMSNWWTYDGKNYLGNPYNRSVAFNFNKDGSAEFFLIIKTFNGYCSTEAFTYQKGKVLFDETVQSFSFVPEQGDYRGFYSCAASSNFNRPAKTEELKTSKYYYNFEKDEAGKEWLVIRFSPDQSEAGSYFKAVEW